MPQRPQKTQQSIEATARMWGELVEGLARSIALTVEAFLHNNFGSGYIGCGFMGIVVMFGFSLLFTNQDMRPLLWFMVAYGARWLFAALITLIRYCRGKDTLHSRYTGRPYLWRRFPNLKESTVKHLEALVVILVGYGVHYLNRPLGDWLMIAATLVFLRVYNLTSQQRSGAVAMNDRVIDQQMVAERFRKTHDP